MNSDKAPRLLADTEHTITLRSGCHVKDEEPEAPTDAQNELHRIPPVQESEWNLAFPASSTGRQTRIVSSAKMGWWPVSPVTWPEGRGMRRGQGGLQQMSESRALSTGPLTGHHIT